MTFSALACRVADYAGRPWATAVAFLIVLAWAASGPAFGFSDTWQLVINTGTTVVTFLMVFLIQASQNRDGAAIQAKLDELIRASKARDKFIGIDKLPREEVDQMREGGK